MPLIVLALFIILSLAIFFIVAYFSATVIFKLFKVVFETWQISSLPGSMAQSLQDARDYARRIKRMAQQHPPGPMQDRLNRMTYPVDEWLTNLNRLEQALSRLYKHRDIKRELRRVTLEIEQIQRQLLICRDPEAASLRALMQSKKKHYAVLEELQSFRNQTELRIRKIASDLGAAYSEMTLVSAKGDFNDNRFQRLDDDLQDNLNSLRDILAAMDEMGYSSATAT
jgi:hypothetical protein